MKPIAIIGSSLLIPFAVMAQSLPSIPKTSGVGLPSMPGASSTTGLPGTSQPSNPIEQAKTELTCKIPTNALKPECIELMMKK